MGLIGSAIGAAGSIFGGISASKAMKKIKSNVEAQRQKNQNWYDRRYNEDYTQRADAQRILTQTEESIKNRNRQAAVNNAIVLYRLAVERRDVEEAQRVYFVTEKLAQTLANPLIPLTKKYDIIEKVYGFESEPKLITSFIKEMVKLGYAAEMNEIFEAYYRYWDEKNHIIRAELISAEAATDEEANDAKALLQSKYPEYEISLTQKVDETLLGGYVIKTLNTEYDRSYEGKLRELERKLTRR